MRAIEVFHQSVGKRLRAETLLVKPRCHPAAGSADFFSVRSLHTEAQAQAWGCNAVIPATAEVEAESEDSQGHPHLHSEFKAA